MKNNTRGWIFGILPNGQISSTEQAKEIFGFAQKIEAIFKSLIPS